MLLWLPSETPRTTGQGQAWSGSRGGAGGTGGSQAAWPAAKHSAALGR